MTIVKDPELERLLKKALALPPESRAALAGSLIESLDEIVDADAAEAWELEIARRIRDVDSGRVTCVPWSEARRKIIGS